MSEANLFKADLSDVTLPTLFGSPINLSNADLSEAVGITEELLTTAKKLKNKGGKNIHVSRIFDFPKLDHVSAKIAV